MPLGDLARKVTDITFKIRDRLHKHGAVTRVKIHSVRQFVKQAVTDGTRIEAPARGRNDTRQSAILSHAGLQILKPLFEKRNDVEIDQRLLHGCLRVVCPTELFSGRTIGEAPEKVGIGGADTAVINVIQNLISRGERGAARHVLMCEIRAHAVRRGRFLQALDQHVAEAVIGEHRLEGVLLSRGNQLIDMERGFGIEMLRVHAVILGNEVFVDLLRIAERDLITLVGGQRDLHIARHRHAEINEISVRGLGDRAGCIDLRFPDRLTTGGSKLCRDRLLAHDRGCPIGIVITDGKPRIVRLARVVIFTAAQMAVDDGRTLLARTEIAIADEHAFSVDDQ